MYAARVSDLRQAGKRGLRRGRSVPALRLSLFRTTAPTAPPSGDVSRGIEAWGMDGNDQYGDCGPAATDHYQVAKSGEVTQIDKLGGIGPVALYFEYGTSQGEPGPKPDQGVTNASWLKFLFDKKIIEAYAELDVTNVTEVHQAMIDFSGVLVGVQLNSNAETQFNNHQPWSLANGQQATPNEGHDILLVKYDASGDTFVTWGALQPATVKWDGTCITEAWVVVTSDDAARVGIDITALKQKIAAFGGTVATKLSR